jgi:hypothetical protein
MISEMISWHAQGSDHAICSRQARPPDSAKKAGARPKKVLILTMKLWKLAFFAQI